MSGACPRLGFTVRLALDASLHERARLDLRTSFARALDRLGLETVDDRDGARPPSGPERWHPVVTRVGSQTTAADRDAVLAWVAGCDVVLGCEAGPLIDLDA